MGKGKKNGRVIEVHAQRIGADRDDRNDFTIDALVRRLAAVSKELVAIVGDATTIGIGLEKMVAGAGDKNDPFTSALEGEVGIVRLAALFQSELVATSVHAKEALGRLGNLAEGVQELTERPRSKNHR